jgi:DNA polymerase-3 subunit gamma/tau
LLLTWLNIANQCDINYKASKNQRLSVELALMKMAHVSHLLSPDQFGKINGSSTDQAALKKKLV